MRSPRLRRGLLAVVVLVGLLGLGLWVGSGDATTEQQTVASPSLSSASPRTPARPTAPTRTPTRTAAPAGETDPASGLRWTDLGDLPQQAQQTVALIERGGPYPYSKDGVTFGNRERILPRQPGGYYREYTVVTPGEGDRGARRIVTGDDDREFFYTGDHYDSFVRIRR